MNPPGSPKVVCTNLWDYHRKPESLGFSEKKRSSLALKLARERAPSDCFWRYCCFCNRVGESFHFLTVRFIGFFPIRSPPLTFLLFAILWFKNHLTRLLRFDNQTAALGVSRAVRWRWSGFIFIWVKWIRDDFRPFRDNKYRLSPKLGPNWKSTEKMSKNVRWLVVSSGSSNRSTPWKVM